jgi:hypothetical protein
LARSLAIDIVFGKDAKRRLARFAEIVSGWDFQLKSRALTWPLVSE